MTTAWQQILNQSSATELTSGLCPLPSYRVLRVSGDNAAIFLQGQLSCDVEKLETQQAMLGTFNNPKGRMLAIFYLLQQDNDYCLVLPQSIADNTLTQLNKVALFSRVGVTETDELVLAIMDHAVDITSYGIDNNSALVIADADSMQQLAITQHLPEQAWHYHLVQQRIAQLTSETVATFTPHDAGLVEAGAVSFDKGCYCGQEVIARMQYLGKLKQHCQLLSCQGDAAPQAGSAIVTSDNPDRAVGHIICSVSYQQQTLALAVLKDAALDGQLQSDNQPLQVRK